jgi:thiol-disulfide isomerase/thioredoxin
MTDGNPLRQARMLTSAIANLAAVGVCFILGCADKEMVAPAPAQSAVADRPAQTRPAAEAPSDAAPAAATASAVTVDPASPEELKKFIESQRGKVVLVDFWATYCLPCREKFPRTLALAKKYTDQGLVAVSMSMDSPEPSYQKKIIEFLKQQNSEIKNFANRLEDPDVAFAALDIVGGALPHYKIYGRDGKVRTKFGGDPDHPFNDSDIERALVEALREHQPLLP